MKLSPDELTEDINNSLNMQDSHSTSGLVGKFRTSLKKKISVKGISGLTKTPPRPVPRKKAEDDDEKGEGEEEEAEDVEEAVGTMEDVAGKYAEEVVEEIVETTRQSAEEGGEATKKTRKKKKKRRPTEEELDGEGVEVVESTPVKAGGVKLPDFAASPVVTAVETEEISYEVTTEDGQGASSGKVKKTKRRTHRKKTEQEVEDDEQVF